MSSRATCARRCSSRISGRRSGRPSADELPSVPLRPLAVHAQRIHRRVRGDQARPGARGRRIALSRDQGQADTEVLFYLALSFGWTIRRGRAGHRLRGGRRAQARHHYPFQGTIATSDGEGLWAFRYSTEGTSRSLFFSRDVRAVRQLYPGREVLSELSDDARLVVSEPIGDLPGAWNEMPEAQLRSGRQGRRPAPALRRAAPAESPVAAGNRAQGHRPAGSRGPAAGRYR